MVNLTRTTRFRPRNRIGITLPELLVCLAVSGVLLALLIPAVRQARETARRMQCASNLKQLALACANYESQHGMYPPGATGLGFGWLVCLLPHLDQQAVYNRLDFSKPTSQQTDVNRLRLPGLTCPSDGRAGLPAPGVTASVSYAANTGTGIQASGFNGMFRHTASIEGFPGGPILVRDVLDGVSQTALLSEALPGDGTGHWLRTEWYLTIERSAPQQLDEFADACVRETPRQTADGDWYGDTWSRGRVWTHGDSGSTWYNHVLTPQSPSCFNGSRVQYGAYTAASLHAGGVNVAYADGHVAIVTASIDQHLWRGYGSRADRELGR